MIWTTDVEIALIVMTGIVLIIGLICVTAVKVHAQDNQHYIDMRKLKDV